MEVAINPGREITNWWRKYYVTYWNEEMEMDSIEIDLGPGEVASPSTFTSKLRYEVGDKYVKVVAWSMFEEKWDGILF